MHRTLSAGLLGCVLLACTGVANGAVITVTTGADPIDIDWQTATVADLPGPDGDVSFAEAMIAANNTPGHDIIEFAIPESKWQLQWLYPGYAVVYAWNTYFWNASESVTLDGSTQEAFTGDRHPGDAELRFYGGAVSVSGGNSTFTGVHGGEVNIGGSNNLVHGNTGGIHISLFGGWGTEIRNNVAGTIKIDRSSNNTVTGNIAQRVRIWGAAAAGMPGDGNVVGGPSLADRNFIVGYGTTNSEGLPAGHAVQLASVNNTVIENNWIGTTPDGLAQGNTFCTMGIGFQGENTNTVVRNNRIAGILGQGRGPHHAGQVFGRAIMISGSGSGIHITGNTIGLDANDEPLLGSVTGIEVGTWAFTGVTDIQITGNTVAGNLFNGISIGRDVVQARVSANRVFANAALGIDLVPSGYGYGVTPNDALDADTGGNGLQNVPVLADATSDGTQTGVNGTLHSSPASDFVLEFFASPSCNPSGFGEGELFLGSTTVTTDASGDAPFDVVLPSGVEAGWAVTATATLEPLGATSEFSACLAVTAGTVTDVTAREQPPRARLLGASPNPFNPRTVLAFELPRPGHAQLDIFDLSGHHVKTLVDAPRGAGRHFETWDGHDDAGRTVGSGVYVYRLRALGYVEARKVTLLK